MSTSERIELIEAWQAALAAICQAQVKAAALLEAGARPDETAAVKAVAQVVSGPLSHALERLYSSVHVGPYRAFVPVLIHGGKQ